MISLTTEATRRCRTCLHVQPREAFRLRRKGTDQRHAECPKCHRDAERERNHRRRAKAFAKVTYKIRKARSPLEVAKCVSEDVLRRFGGLDGFVRMWHEQIASARTGGLVAFAHIYAIVRLLELADRHRQEAQAAEIDGMSDEELAAEIKRLLRQDGNSAGSA
jgi:hypothetical protein